jgi:hypothetical protein
MTDVKNDEQRTAFLPRARCTKKERLAIENKAAQAGVSLSEYQRRALLDCAIITRTPIVDVRAVVALGHIGNNLNQLIRKEHIHDEADTQKMRDILAVIDDIVMGIVDDP